MSQFYSVASGVCQKCLMDFRSQGIRVELLRFYFPSTNSKSNNIFSINDLEFTLGGFFTLKNSGILICDRSLASA